MDDREEKKTNKQSYKARKKREYRARRRKREARSKNDDSGSLDNADQGNQPVTREQSEDEETPAAKIEEGEVEKYALIGDFPIPLEYKRMSGERSPSSSSSTSEIGAELNEAMLWRPDHETEEIVSRLKDKCQNDDCETARKRSAIEVERLKEQADFARRKSDKMARLADDYKLKFHYASGMQSREMMENIDQAINFRGYNLLSVATADNRLQSNAALLKQGISIISESELSIGLLIGKGPNANIYEAIYKGAACAVKVYKGSTFPAVCREYHILMLLSSHPGIPHAFGVMRGCAPKLVLSSFNHTCERLNSVVFETREEFGRFAASFMDIVLHLQKKQVLHNNINPSNILVDKCSRRAVLCGFSNSCYGTDGYLINGSRALERFGDLCCLPSEVKRAGISLSFESDVYSMGFVLMWHLRVADTAVGDLTRYVRGLTQDCVGRPHGRRPGPKRLEKALEHIRRSIMQ